MEVFVAWQLVCHIATSMEKPDKRYHKSIRLDKILYGQAGRLCSITACTHDRQPIFAQYTKLTQECILLVREYCKRFHIELWVYCFMPDHLHLLISASAEKSILDCIRELKSLTTRIAWKYGINGQLWQKGFYDHFLRSDEQIETVVSYILNNPVRQGLVEKWKDYPHSGSLNLNLQHL